MTIETSLHSKYRPSKLDRIIGHETAVTRLKGLIASKKIPNAIAFFGPTSVGKTTLARALAFELNNKPASKQVGYKELNAADQRGIDDVRDLVKVSKFRTEGYRIIVIDEAQQLVSNNAAAQTLLKPLEEPSPKTLWVICSMDPSKFTTGVGKAIANRCTQFVLEPHTNADLLKQALRIAKGEEMSYVLTEDRKVLKAVVENSNGEMRTLANLMQSLQEYYDGLEKKPKLLSAEHITNVLSSTESADDQLAVDCMIGVYSGDFAKVQLSLLSVADQFGFMKKLTWLAAFMMNVAVLKGAKHPKVWWSAPNRKLKDATADLKLKLDTLALTNATIVRVAAQASSFQIPATDLLSAELYMLIKTLSGK